MVEALACSSAAAADAPPSPAADDDTAGEVGEHEGPGLKKKKKKKKSKKKKKPQDTAQDMPIVYAEVRELDTFRIEQDAVSGRCVVAARNLEAGQLVIHEPPFAKVVRRDCADRHCANCCRQVTEGATIAADVPFAVYCSRACKAQEEALRSAEAEALDKLAGISAARDVDLDLLRMVLRLLVTRAKALGLGPPRGDGSGNGSGDGSDKEGHGQREGGAVEEKGSFLLEQWRNLYALMHHREDMPPTWVAVVRAASEDLSRALPEWARFDVEETVQLACRVNVNAHGLRDDSGSNLVIGVGLFPLTAMINHSCRPNCAFVYHGGELEVRTLEPVPAGTELNVYYIDLLQDTAARRRELLASKHFLCKCDRCENPSAADWHLDGVCCADCGPSGCLSPTPPPTPEDALAAQLAQLGELNGESSTLPDKSSTANGAAGGGNSSKGKRKGSKEGGGDGDGGKPSGAGGGEGDIGTMYCSSCGRTYSAAAAKESLSRAKSSWDAAMAILRAKNFPTARKSLEKWLQDFDAGSTAASSAAGKKKPPAGKKGRLRLHPDHALVVQTLVSLSNCCNFEGDFAASARHLRRAVSAMEAVYPQNYPELGDFHAALADAITSFLEKRGQTLPKKTKSQTISERKQALERAAAIRTVCLGEEHPTTRAAVAAVGRPG